ncbi:MAG: hypothetical protein NT031_10025, partial [Planctomycetota bacterium]|nr:hypothetical protein [Planctomycetota bacterium]
QGSNTARDDDWTDVYRCEASGRETSPFPETPRCRTTLFSSFASGEMAKALPAAEAKKVVGKLAGKTIAKADFVRPAGAYTWYRLVIYSCFGQSAGGPVGCSLGQLELFGVPGKAAPIKKQEADPDPVGIEPAPSAFDPAFIISFWCAPTKAETTLARYKEIADCGMNLALTPCGPDDPAARLDLCQKVGIKAVVGLDLPASKDDPDFTKKLDAQIAKYASHPALSSYFIDDEPGVPKFEYLAAVNQYLLKKDPKHLPYINLLPNYAGDPAWNGPAYEQSVAKYIDVVKPALVSWDHYRQMFEGGDESYYWRNLEIIRKLSLKAKTPMIQIIVSIKHMGYRECSEADLRWQVYTSLAYGSHGIIFFTYWDVPGMAWADAPALITMDAPVKKADGGPLTIGCFVDRNAQEYIMVVNRSFNATCTAKLTLSEKIVAAAEISRETGKCVAPVSVAGKTLDVPLEAGDGRLFRLDRKK